jgi:hypothetical protein
MLPNPYESPLGQDEENLGASRLRSATRFRDVIHVLIFVDLCLLCIALACVMAFLALDLPADAPWYVRGIPAYFVALLAATLILALLKVFADRRLAKL